MAETNLPRVPVDIDPNDRHVEFTLCECRHCGQRSGWVRIEYDEHGRITERPALWHHEHIAERGAEHAKFYEYTLTRNTGETWIPRNVNPRNKENR